MIFLATLGTLHLLVAVPAFLHSRWEGYVSAILSVAFLTAAVVMYHARSQFLFDSPGRRIRVRSGVDEVVLEAWKYAQTPELVVLRRAAARWTEAFRVSENWCLDPPKPAPGAQAP